MKGATENASTENTSTGDGIRKYGKRKYECAGVENASTETWRTRLSVNGRVQRTNNAVESFHNTFGRLVQVSHPSFYTFMEYLLEVTLSNMADVQRLDRRGQIRRPKKKQNICLITLWTCNFLSAMYRHTHCHQFSLSCVSMCHIYYCPVLQLAVE